jgi:hypothetical protein
LLSSTFRFVADTNSASNGFFPESTVKIGGRRRGDPGVAVAVFMSRGKDSSKRFERHHQHARKRLDDDNKIHKIMMMMMMLIGAHKTNNAFSLKKNVCTPQAKTTKKHVFGIYE